MWKNPILTYTETKMGGQVGKNEKSYSLNKKVPNITVDELNKALKGIVVVNQ